MYLGHRIHILAWYRLSLHISFSWTALVFSLQPQIRLMVPLCNVGNAFAPQKLRVPCTYTSFLRFHNVSDQQYIYIYTTIMSSGQRLLLTILIEGWFRTCWEWAVINSPLVTFFRCRQHPNEWRIRTINVEQFLPQINSISTWISGWYYRKVPVTILACCSASMVFSAWPYS